MAFFTIAGADYWILEGGADEGAPENGGQSRRAIDGSLRTGVFWSKRNYRFTLEPLTAAAFETFSALHGTIATVTGDAVVDGDYEIAIDSSGFIRTSDTAYKRGPVISLRRV